MKKPIKKNNFISVLVIILVIGIITFWVFNIYPKSFDYKFTGFGLSEAENEFITCYVKSQEDICKVYGGTIEGFKMPVCVFPEKYEKIGEIKLGEALASCNEVYLEALNNSG